MTNCVLELNGVSKQFVLHHRNRAQLRVLRDVNMTVSAGECVVLDGPSGMGKSTLLKLIYANYRTSAGNIMVYRRDSDVIDITVSSSQDIVKLRRDTISYVSQFLRVIPRVSALDVVAEPLVDDAANDVSAIVAAESAASALLSRLRIPERLWHLPPATFSGGEQQRVNIARNLIKAKPLLLLDEPTASLDAANTETVVAMIREARERGAAIVGIFHDRAVGDAVATRRVDIADFRSQD
jgi:alpha-D-ribose 1-methylphosphonate 5-triphosphate synthase subunit PhnL